MLAAKTLTVVEVDPAISNQHEFHAGTLRALLRFDGETRGSLFTHFYLEDGVDPVLDTDDFFLYDARAANPKRSEWHLYYYSKVIPQLARPGDLLVLLRPDRSKPDLYGLIARPGTQFERQLRQALDIGDIRAIQRFVGVERSHVPQGQAAQIALPLVAPAAEEAGDVSRHPVFLEALRSGRMPNTKTMANAAFELVRGRDGSLDADEYLSSALDAESELFFAIESTLGERELKELLDRGAGLEEVLSFALGKHQARKSRRGLSLQNHLEVLLEQYGIPYSSQCTTEPGETPDFIIPGCREYHDPHFPAGKLFMIGCKSKLRDRWRQHLNEARRIRTKFHVSLDPDLSDDVIERMHAEALQLFIPRSIIESCYAEKASRYRLRTIADLIQLLRVGTHDVR